MHPEDLTQPVPIPETHQIPPIVIRPDDPDDEWALPESGKVLRVRYFTGILLILLALGGGFWGGVVAEKHHGTGTSTATSPFASRIAALRAAGAPGGGFGGAAAAGGGGLGGAGATTGGAAGGIGAGGAAAGTATPTTSGTVIDVSGDVLEISDSQGQIVKITVGPSAIVSIASKASLSGLKIGDTVVVAGSRGSGGTLNATSVTATAGG